MTSQNSRGDRLTGRERGGPVHDVLHALGGECLAVRRLEASRIQATRNLTQRTNVRSLDLRNDGQESLGVGGHSVSGAVRVADVEELVASGTVHVRVLGAEVVKVRISRFAPVQPVAVAPKMLAVPAGGEAEAGRRLGLARVHPDDVVRVRRVLVQGFERVGRVEPGAAAVGDDGVIVKDLVERLAKRRARFAFGGGIVAGRRVRTGGGRADEQSVANKK